MTDKNRAASSDPEIAAITKVHEALKALEHDAQLRVLMYVEGKLGVRRGVAERQDDERSRFGEDEGSGSTAPVVPPQPGGGAQVSDDGVNAVAIKWMTRNSFSVAQLASIFSFGGDEIDLIVKGDLGASKKERTHSVLLLKGIAAFLGSGAARVSHEQLKETCLHYDAYDNTNFAKYVKAFSSEMTGSKQAGYTLNQRGLAAAADLLRKLSGVQK